MVGDNTLAYSAFYAISKYESKYLVSEENITLESLRTIIKMIRKGNNFSRLLEI